MASEQSGPEQYVEGRLVAVILLVITGLGALAATTFCGGRGCAVAAPVTACTVVVALVLLAWLNRGTRRAKHEGRSYLLAFALGLGWSALVSAVVLTQTADGELSLARWVGVTCGVFGGVAMAAAAYLWHGAARTQRPRRRPVKAERALAQVKERL